MLTERLSITYTSNSRKIIGFIVYLLVNLCLCAFVHEQEGFVARLLSFPHQEDHHERSSFFLSKNSVEVNEKSHHELLRKLAKDMDGDDATVNRNTSPQTRRLGGISYQKKYHKVTQLLSSKNITLAHLGIHQQDPIRVFFSEDSMCDDEPPSSNGDVLLKNLSSSPSSPQYNQEPEPTYYCKSTTTMETIAVAIMVPLGQCTFETKIRNVVKWYQEDHPNVKVVMFYDPILPPSSDEASMGSAVGVPSIPQNGKHGDIRETSTTQGSIHQKIDLSSVTNTIVPFHVSQRTALLMKQLSGEMSLFDETQPDNTNNYVDVIMSNQPSQSSTAGGTKTMTKKQETLTFISDIYVSFVVTILSLVVTGILLLLCWKDALAIEITRDGVLIISNVTSVGDSHLTEGTEDKRATLSAEHVLALPEVKFDATHPTNEATRRMPSSSSPSCAAAGSAPTTSPSTTRQDMPQQDIDEESCLPFLSSDNDHFNVEIKLPQDRGLPCFCCNTTCSICLEDFTADESLRLLPCGHVFHTSCILPWLTKRATSCPLCKKCLAHSESES